MSLWSRFDRWWNERARVRAMVAYGVQCPYLQTFQEPYPFYGKNAFTKWTKCNRKRCWCMRDKLRDFDTWYEI